jgi:hypothetical protein
MSQPICKVCQRPQAVHECGLCHVNLCKKCELFVEPESFTFMEKVHRDFNLGHYCPECYEERMAPQIEKYEQLLERAKSIYIFFDTSSHPHTLKKISNKPMKLSSSRDRDETILRMGFRAAEQGYNAVVEVVVERITNQRNFWQGTGTPANIDAAKHARWDIYNP